MKKGRPKEGIQKYVTNERMSVKKKGKKRRNRK